jgi:predicted nucleic acid-binding protein
LQEKAVILTRHATERYVSLSLNPELISDIVRHGKRVRLSRTKWSASRRTKYGNIVVIYVEYPEFFKVITITKGRKSA